MLIQPMASLPMSRSGFAIEILHEYSLLQLFSEAGIANYRQTTKNYVRLTTGFYQIVAGQGLAVSIGGFGGDFWL